MTIEAVGRAPGGALSLAPEIGPAPEVGPAPDLETAVLAALAEVSDPEIPGVSIVDLGMVGGLDVAADRIRVDLLPTFVGCPAIEMIRSAIRERLAEFGRVVDAPVSYAQPWTTERITPEGRRKLRELGFAPPVQSTAPQFASSAARGSGRDLPMLAVLPAAECPYCGSRRTTLENAFGPTACRAIYHCADCRQPFEQFKTV